jgi:membrane-bound lytic murein transglycosylase B
MSARVGFGVVLSGMLALAAWLTIGAVTAGSSLPAPAVAAVDAGAVVGQALAPAPPAAAGAGAEADGSAGAPDAPGTPGAPGAAAGPPASVTPAGSNAVALSAPVVPRGPAIATLVDPAWASGVAAATGIPTRALHAYAGAALSLAASDPGCGVGWNTIAALGAVESGHGTHAGSSIRTDGSTVPPILGPDLDGGEYDLIADTDGGLLDDLASGDRAVGPLQFIPGTWAEWGADGNGDARADPQQIDDAALAAGRYLCHYGDLRDPAAWRTAVFAYNHVESYVDLVAATANDYSARAAGVPTAGADG